MLVAAATMVSFTSCNKDDKDDATAPEAEYTFAGTTDNGQLFHQYLMVFLMLMLVHSLSAAIS